MQLPVTSGYSDALCEDGGTCNYLLLVVILMHCVKMEAPCNYLLLVVILMHCVKMEAHAITCY